VAVILKIQDIDEAITNLQYRSKETLKYKLIHILRQYYADDSSVDSLQSITHDEIIKSLWCIGDDPESIKGKRKNLSSIKSGVNADLKKLYHEGKNSQGVIVGPNNVFTMSDEAKDKALESVAAVFKEKGSDTIGTIAEVLSAVNDILSNSGSLANSGEGNDTFDRVKGLILDVSRKIGLSLPGEMGTGVIGSTGSDITVNAIAGKTTDNLTAAVEEDTLIDAADEIIEDQVGEIELVEEVIESEMVSEVYEEIDDNAAEDSMEVDVCEADEGAIRDNGEEVATIEDNLGDELALSAGADIVGSPVYEDLSDVEEAAMPFLQEMQVENETAQEDWITDEIDASIEELDNETTIREEDADRNSIQEGISDGGAAAGYVVETKEIDYFEDIPPLGTGSCETSAAANEDVEEIIEEAGDEITISETVGGGDLEEIEAGSETEEVEGEIPAEQEFSEEAMEEVGAESVTEVLYGDEEDSYKKSEIFGRLSEAAKFLATLGPELENRIFYDKGEIKEKAMFLSEEFERELSIREKYFSQHILIKSGEYIIGGVNGNNNESPTQKVHIQEFYIGKFPVTNALFDIFVEKTGYMTTAERCGYGFVYTPRAQKTRDIATGMETFIWSGNLQYRKVQGACWHRPNGPGSSLYNKRRHPVVQVSLEDTRAFAAWTGKRIPTEKEWEAAARTSRGYLYPWGNQWKENACNIDKSYIGDTTPVDKYLETVNGSGVADTLGNVLEWTLDRWRSYPSGEKNKDIYIAKGGSWISDSSISLSRQFPVDKNTTSNILGFRCVAI
jgi:formylglycine-generating enzyme required for sulfatase activity